MQWKDVPNEECNFLFFSVLFVWKCTRIPHISDLHLPLVWKDIPENNVLHCSTKNILWEIRSDENGSYPCLSQKKKIIKRNALYPSSARLRSATVGYGVIDIYLAWTTNSFVHSLILFVCQKIFQNCTVMYNSDRVL